MSGEWRKDLQVTKSGRHPSGHLPVGPRVCELFEPVAHKRALGLHSAFQVVPGRSGAPGGLENRENPLLHQGLVLVLCELVEGFGEQMPIHGQEHLSATAVKDAEELGLNLGKGNDSSWV
jgi:hypothetical protein